jgi:hypothetical protein
MGRPEVLKGPKTSIAGQTSPVVLTQSLSVVLQFIDENDPAHLIETGAQSHPNSISEGFFSHQSLSGAARYRSQCVLVNRDAKCFSALLHRWKPTLVLKTWVIGENFRRDFCCQFVQGRSV